MVKSLIDLLGFAEIGAEEFACFLCSVDGSFEFSHV
jgi:hypothetical protein